VTRRTNPPAPLTPPGGVTRYRDRIFDDRRHDPYQAKQKYAEPTVCSDCRAVFARGRWQWGDAPQGAHEARCPACRRVRDKLPAGFVKLQGAFVASHREELIRLARNEETREKGEHPLQRIMGIDEAADGVVITTTDIHLPQRIGEALKHAYHGDLDLHYGEDEYSVRVQWRR
jgi:hypothetical protein